MPARTSARLFVYASIVCLVVLSTLAVHCNAEMSKLVGLDFEVFGRVQGVFFRKVSALENSTSSIINTKDVANSLGTYVECSTEYTQKRGEELSLKGWCRNTKEGTVVGRIEGEKSKIDEMKQWLQRTGSPKSAIDKAEFRNEKEIPQVTFAEFSIKK